MNARVEPVTLRLREPLRTAYGNVTERELLLLRIEDADGNVGWGEAAPLESYDGVSLQRCASALAAHATVLNAAPPEAGGPHLLDACRDADPLDQAIAAVDIALWDLAGRREGRPIAELLTDAPLRSVTVNATVGATDRASAAAQAADAARAGFRCVKLKVGVGDDAGRVAAVRSAVGPDVALRLDANGAWSVEEAVTAINSLAAAGLELVEEPVHGIDAVRALRERVAVRVAIDETVAEPGALAGAAADAVCLKVSRAGGISGLLAQATLVRSTGADVYLASTLDGPIGIAAALHCAAALRVDIPCGLATLTLFDGLADFGLRPVAGEIALPPGAGLGVDGASLLAP